MKRVYYLAVTVLALYAGCKVSDPCEGFVTYYKLDPRLHNYVFKPGTYWVYSDSADGIIDSQYVYAYTYYIHSLWFPADTYGLSKCKEAVYADVLNESIYSFQNNVLKDTFIIGGGFIKKDIIATLCISYQAGRPPTVPFFDPTVTIQGPVNSLFSFIGKIDKLNSANGAFFNDVLVFQTKGSTTNSLYQYDTDFYFVSGFGIVRIVEHTPNRLVSHDLIRYHIVK